MSCYFRHLKEIFQEAGIEVSAANRKQIDRTIHRLLGIDINDDCPTTWKMLKQQVLSDEDKGKEFITRLKAAVSRAEN